MTRIYRVCLHKKKKPFPKILFSLQHNQYESTALIPIYYRKKQLNKNCHFGGLSILPIRILITQT